VQYNLAGSVLHTYSIAGSVDGLKFDPNTGQIWALQNQDANSTLTIINPPTATTSTLTYGSLYNSMSGTRGLDDVVFSGNKVFMSVTNPGNGTDPVVVQLPNLASPFCRARFLPRAPPGRIWQRASQAPSRPRTRIRLSRGRTVPWS
jgi:hypothetical protein